VREKEKERVKKRGSWWSKGKERLGLTAEALPPPQLAGRAEGPRPAVVAHLLGRLGVDDF
jgi:hypothetical protein